MKDRVIISCVMYAHEKGIPARIFSGLVEPMLFGRNLVRDGVEVVIRLVDPFSIAAFCNGWSDKSQNSWLFAKLLDWLNELNGESQFFSRCFIDSACDVTGDSLALLDSLSACLRNPDDDQVGKILSKLTASASRHGGESGSSNMLRYAAAHPFSWLQMFDSRIWGYRPNADINIDYMNMMSPSEKRFLKVSEYLRKHASYLQSGINPINIFTRICKTPSYIPLPDEPLLSAHTNPSLPQILELYTPQIYNLMKQKSTQDRVLEIEKDVRAIGLLLGQQIPC